MSFDEIFDLTAGVYLQFLSYTSESIRCAERERHIVYIFTFTCRATLYKSCLRVVGVAVLAQTRTIHARYNVRGNSTGSRHSKVEDMEQCGMSPHNLFPTSNDK